MSLQLTDAERQSLLMKWRSPAGKSESDRQDRAERMVKQAVRNHEPFAGLDLSVAAKGSYPNHTNVRGDSDVDIKVQVNDPYHADIDPSVFWWGGTRVTRYTGPWKPKVLRQEMFTALENHFGTVDANHNVAFFIPEVNGSRPSIDVVPCFRYLRFTDLTYNESIEGSIVYGRDGKEIVNWPDQQLRNGQAKNTRTNHRYKFAVRVLKSVENELAAQRIIRPLPSYFSECLVYNVPDEVLTRGSLDDSIRGSLANLNEQLHFLFGRPADMLEPNEVKKLFQRGQKWTARDATQLIRAAWHYLNYR